MKPSASRARRPRRDFFRRGAGAAVADVIRDGNAEQRRILQHHAEGGAQIRMR
jgi:hypothetical protein